MNQLEMFHGKKCASCGRFFVVNPRIGERQKCCGPECRKKRKRMQEETWKKQNPKCFQGLYATYVKPWRQAHPDYQKQWRAAQKGLRVEIAAEIKTQIPSETPIKSMRIHLRCPLRLGEIKTQWLRVRQVGQAFWIDGGETQAA